jgi:hypothetical protein
MKLIKYLLPLALLACKAKIQQDKIQVINQKSVTCKTDTSKYHWSNEFSDKQLRELCENVNLVINNAK